MFFSLPVTAWAYSYRNYQWQSSIKYFPCMQHFSASNSFKWPLFWKHSVVLHSKKNPKCSIQTLSLTNSSGSYLQNENTFKQYACIYSHVRHNTAICGFLLASVRNTKGLPGLCKIQRHLTYLIKAAIFLLQGFKIKRKKKLLSVLHFNEHKPPEKKKKKNTRVSFSYSNRKEQAGMNSNFIHKIWIWKWNVELHRVS